MTAEPSDHQLRELLREAKTIAVVGLSPDVFRPSNGVARSLQRSGYDVIPVNPNADEILGEKSYQSLADIPEPVDIVDVFRRSEFASAVVDEAMALQPKLIFLQLGVYDKAAAARANAAGIPIVMDRCILIEHQRLL